jgi:hypothetical protein
MHRRLIAPVLVVLVVLLTPSVARGDGSGDAFNDGTQVGADAGNSGSGGGGGSGGGHSNCTYEPLDAEGIAAAEGLAKGGYGPQPGTGPGTWYRKICYDANGQSTGTVVWLPAAVDPAVLAQQASDRAPIPLPDVHLNPPEGGEQVVNVVTWLWIDKSVWQPVSADASAGGVTVTATAVPESVTWNMGNGDTVNCAGPGTAYDPNRPSSEQHTDCSYVYRHSSSSAPDGAFTASATITWHVTWTAVGVAGGGDLGQASRTTTFAVRVAEIQAVNQ